MDLGDLVGGALELELGELLRQRLRQTLRPASPAVGTDLSLSVPAGCAWELVSLRATLTTSATVANRVPVLRLSDANGVLADVPPTIVQAASLAQVYEWIPSYPIFSVGSPAIAAIIPTPEILLPEGATITTVTTALDAGDQWSAIAAVIRQWSLVDVELAAAWYARRSDVLV